MAFTIPAENSFPVSLSRATASYDWIRAGYENNVGPTALLNGDKWIRAHAMRVILTSGSQYAPTVTYHKLFQSTFYVSEESYRYGFLWDHEQTSGTTTLYFTFMHVASASTWTRTQLYSSSTSRTVGGYILETVGGGNFHTGLHTVTVSIKNSSNNGTHHGLSLREYSLISL